MITDADRTHVNDLLAAWREMSGRLARAISTETVNAYTRLTNAARDEYYAACDRFNICREPDCWDEPANDLAYCDPHVKR